jgi:hypothetical protein
LKGKAMHIKLIDSIMIGIMIGFLYLAFKELRRISKKKGKR